MISRTIIFGAATASLIGAAAAADLPPRAPPPVFTPVPVFSWTGFYIGANLGGAFSTQNNRTFAGAAFAPAGTFAAAGPAFAATSGTFVVPVGSAVQNRNNTSAFAGGGQIGYNWQTGPFVWGVEADIQGLAGNNRRGLLGVPAAPFFTTATGPGLPPGALLVPRAVLGTLDWYGTFRGRLGYAVDRTLFYVTGGLAYGEGSLKNNICGSGLLNCNSNIRTGYSVGGGVEYAFTNSWTARIEGMYVNISNNRFNNTGVALGAVGYSAATNTVLLLANGNRNNNGFGVVRAAVNYKFGTY
jgi:outer membrane immunogenic protein